MNNNQVNDYTVNDKFSKHFLSNGKRWLLHMIVGEKQRERNLASAQRRIERLERALEQQSNEKDDMALKQSLSLPKSDELQIYSEPLNYSNIKAKVTKVSSEELEERYAEDGRVREFALENIFQPRN